MQCWICDAHKILIRNNRKQIGIAIVVQEK